MLKGTYLLLARLETKAALTVGRLGTFAFPRGWYAYAGSAMGPGGIPARLAHHCRSEKRTHWHIDYLLAYSTVEAYWYVEATERLECAWAAALSELPAARLLVPRFGASDCRCPGHLVYLPCRPLDREIERALASASPNVRTPPAKGPL